VQSLREGRGPGNHGGLSERAEKSYSGRLFRLLRACCERPADRRTSNSFDEITSSHCLHLRLRTTPTMGLQQGFTTGGMGSDRHFARQQLSGPNVRFGSKADIAAPPTNVRFTPKSGHRNRPADYLRRTGSGSLAIFAAMRRASSRRVSRDQHSGIVTKVS